MSDGKRVGAFLDAVVLGCALGSILLLNESLIRSAGRRLVAQVDSWLVRVAEPKAPKDTSMPLKDVLKVPEEE